MCSYNNGHLQFGEPKYQGYKTKQSALVLSQEGIAPDIYRLTLQCEEIAKNAKAGQFVNLYCDEDSRLLPRPISLCEMNKEEGNICLVYAAIGEGTKGFTNLTKGDAITLLGPLGNGFPIEDHPTNIILGGGVGTPPLLQLVKELKGENHVFLGFRSEPYLVHQFMEYATVHIATDDGSVGYRGTAIDLLKDSGIKGDRIYGCGPRPMLKALQCWSIENDIKGYVSLEERMGCGFGACVGCDCKMKNKDGIQHKRVCHDGPVFDIGEAVFDE